MFLWGFVPGPHFYLSFEDWPMGDAPSNAMAPPPKSQKSEHFPESQTPHLHDARLAAKTSSSHRYAIRNISNCVASL